MPTQKNTPPEPPDETTSAPSQNTGPAPTSERGFFGWLRSLGIVRENGWLGGVCGGLAVRLGIDPIIVRGIVFVVALLGGPAFLFYAVAWALLPDRANQIHLERVLKGVFEPAAVAIVILALLAFLPIAQGVWWVGAPFGGFGGWPESIAKLVLSLVIIGLIVAFIVWAVRGFQGAPWQGRWETSWGASGTSGSSATATAGTAPPASDSASATATVPQPSGTNFTSTDFTSTDTTSAARIPASPFAAPPVAPPALASSASPEDLEDWKRRQAAWKVEYESWKAQQAGEQRAIREQRSAENRANARAYAAQADERRRAKQLANPRTSARFVFATIGLALIAGAVSAWISNSIESVRGFEGTIGLASATLVFGIAIIVAGVLRRRSGFLCFLSIVLLALTLGTIFSPHTVGEFWHSVGASTVQYTQTVKGLS
jgi:phage shock protein PspC (stress-responsive transcriptional regulator)